MLRGMRPHCDGESYVYVSLPSAKAQEFADNALMLFREEEGVTLILTSEHAKAAGLSAGERFAKISLAVFSSLQAVGLTAAVSAALAKANISANMVAGHHHDHVFVPHSDGEAALAVLQKLSASA